MPYITSTFYGARIAALLAVASSDGISRVGVGLDSLSLLSDIKELNRSAELGQTHLSKFLWAQGFVAAGNPRLWSATLGGAFGFSHESKILIGPSFSGRSTGNTIALKVGTTYEFHMNSKWMIAPCLSAEFSPLGTQVLAGVTFFPVFQKKIEDQE